MNETQYALGLSKPECIIISIIIATILVVLWYNFMKWYDKPEMEAYKKYLEKLSKDGQRRKIPTI